MYTRKSKKYNKKIKIIYPGEFYVSKEDELIGTLLGSCISVCLYDPEKKISGMNHYMLPGRISNNDIFNDKSARYGITAINELLYKLKTVGVGKDKLIAKLFGGGHVINNDRSLNIPIDNIRLAKVMMEMEDIAIEEMDVGDKYARKLLMDVQTGKVYLKKTKAKKISQEIVEQEEKFARSRFGSYEQD